MSGVTDEDRVVGGRYRLTGRLGAGAMGAVWRAHDLVLGRDVAVKEVVFPPGTRPEEAEVLRERTRREARSAARLDHPSAVTVYDVVEEDGRPWLVMELVDARTLADVVAADGPLPPARVAQIGLAVLGALQAAHAQGIVHRDVKPGNVMLSAAGRIVLTDFGIATSAEDSSLTGTGLLLGSPAYIAPERARGQAPGPESDLWSLGATLFTAVEGRPPFDGRDALETVTSVVTGEHAAFAAAGPLRAVIDGLLVKDPVSRLDGAGARALLTPVATGTVAAVSPAAEPAPARTDAGTAALHVDEVAELAQARREPYLTESFLAPELAGTPADRPGQVAVGSEGPSRPVVERPAPVRPPRVVREPRRAKDGVARRRPVLPLLAAVLLLVAAAVGLVFSVQGSGTEQRRAGEAPEASASPSAEVAPEVPADWVQYVAPDGWSVFTPPDWTLTMPRGETQLKDEDTRSTLRVNALGPTSDSPSALSEAREAAFGNGLRGYELIGQRSVEFRDGEATDLELLFSDGVALRVLDRSFVDGGEGGEGYQLYWQTPADGWEEARELFDQVAATFRPAPAA